MYHINLDGRKVSVQITAAHNGQYSWRSLDGTESGTNCPLKIVDDAGKDVKPEKAALEFEKADPVMSTARRLDRLISAMRLDPLFAKLADAADKEG
jgi:hypothetical protein